MSVTSVDIDREVLARAKEIYGVRTNREAIDLALRDAILRRRQIEAVDALAALPIDVDAVRIDYP